ncbi:hypothetical protein K437DRAFT_260354 [Tilletiaria anomala UBC 951]|uniref:Uncharacterized protein n=1 Tax=Tilletiaria anomala (strain ATCC 24038 / CBS 436.72 / UBC 951) TaxID=1037660 RepID=A0A066V1F0_TILAU|nr:uncharacterized protein K437DRAFT_260354 [Tilletiaria anomala UBC 951]KDN35532.1 hypothetical protein K437DRAFT_260354 [Tilletiaria anomala UBC 951]
MVRPVYVLGAVVATAAVSAAPIPLGAALGGMMMGGVQASAGNDQNGNANQITDASDRSVNTPIVNQQQYSFNNQKIASAAGAPSPLHWNNHSGAAHGRGRGKRGLQLEDELVRRQVDESLAPRSFSSALGMLGGFGGAQANLGSDANLNSNVKQDTSYRGVTSPIQNQQVYSFKRSVDQDLEDMPLRRQVDEWLAPRGFSSALGMLTGFGGAQASLGNSANTNSNVKYDQSYRGVTSPIQNQQVYSFKRSVDQDLEDMPVRRQVDEWLAPRGFSSALGMLTGFGGVHANLGNSANTNSNVKYDQSYRQVAAPVTNAQVYSF